MTLPWSELPYLLALTRTGTLSAAASLLGVDRTTVARRIEQLEDKLNEPLFERIEGRHTLTPFGHRVFAAAESAEQELHLLEGRLSGAALHRRKVRVSLSEHLMITLAGSFRDFMARHADIVLELTATDRLVDLAHYEADVALRLCRTEPRNLTTRTIGKPVFALYCRKGCEISNNRYIARPSEERVPRYVLKHMPAAELCMAVDGIVSMREMIAEGAGIGVLPRYFGDRDARIERCSSALPNAGFALYILTRPEQQRLHRIKTFVAHVEACLGGMPGFDRGDGSSWMPGSTST